MKKLIPLLLFLGFVLQVKSQDAPKIGSTKGLKEKFLLIKKGLPNIKKNLTKADPMWTDQQNVIFEMGNGIVLFEEDEESESLVIAFSSEPYFSGTLNDFKNFHKQLVTIIGEVFNSSHAPKTENKETSWNTTFYEKGKDIFTSKTYIDIELTWVLNDPHIGITIVRNKVTK